MILKTKKDNHPLAINIRKFQRFEQLGYTDSVLKGEITPSKFLPYFLSKQYGTFNVI